MHEFLIDQKDTNPVIVTETTNLDTALSTESRVDWLLIDVEGNEANVKVELIGY